MHKSLKKIARTCSDESCVCIVNDSAILNVSKLVAIFQIANMHWADGSWFDSSLLGRKNSRMI